jgi:hypothetical protein
MEFLAMTPHISAFSPGASGTDLLRRMTKNQLNGAKELPFAWMLGGRSRSCKRSRCRDRVGLSKPGPRGGLINSASPLITPVFLLHSASAVLLAFLISNLCGCATKAPSKAVPQQQNGVTEYRQITIDAIAAVEVALQSLNRVDAQTSPCSTEVVDAFADEVQRLQIESIRVRAHAQAIQARGDAYFENWSENLARVKDPHVRELAEHFRPQLQQSFSKIKLASQDAGASFRNFFFGLRKLRTSLQTNPETIEIPSMKELIRTTRLSGEQLLQLLGSIKVELQTMTAMLTPVKSARSAPEYGRTALPPTAAALSGSVRMHPI